MYTVVYEKDSQLRWITFPAESFSHAETIVPRMCGDCTIISIAIHSQVSLSFGNGIHLSHYLKDET